MQYIQKDSHKDHEATKITKKVNSVIKYKLLVYYYNNY
jgi:hypothetical protein